MISERPSSSPAEHVHDLPIRRGTATNAEHKCNSGCQQRGHDGMHSPKRNPEYAQQKKNAKPCHDGGHSPRRVGPFDAVASRYGVQCQGCDELALTLLDVLDYMEEVPIVTAYRLTDGSTTTRFPMGKTLDDAQPVVEKVPGWHCDITGVRKFEDLPVEAQNYVKRLEELVGCKIKYISVSPERDACIVRE